MGMSRCYSLMKCLLILFNIIFLVVGLVVLALCVWAAWETGAGGGAARAGLGALAGWAAALALGAAAALAGGARDSPSLLASAFALLALCGVAEAAAAAWGAAHLPQLRAALVARLRQAVALEYHANYAPTQFIDAIQAELQCCGVDGPRDWQHSAWSRAQADAGAGAGAGSGAGAAADDALDLSVSAPSAYYYVPPTCCVKPEEEYSSLADDSASAAACAAARRVPAASSSAPGLHAAPCAPAVLAKLEASARLPLLLGAGLLALHAVTLLLTLALCLRARPQHRHKA